MDWKKIFDKKKMRKAIGQDEPFDRGEGDEGYERMKKEYAKRKKKEKQKAADKKKYGYKDGGVKFDKLKELLRSKK